MENRCSISVIVTFIKRNARLPGLFSSALFHTLYHEIKTTNEYSV